MSRFHDALVGAAVLLPILYSAVGDSWFVAAAIALMFAGVAVALRWWVGRAERDLAAELDRLAFTDPLTGLANRVLFRDRLDHARHRAMRDDNHVIVLLIDVDDFRDVTSVFGHSHGDALLKALAGRLRDALQGSDTVARLGGDEFAVLVEAAGDVDDVAAVVRRVLSTVAEPFTHAGRTVELRISIGAVIDGGERDVDAMLRDAELAMYEAKADRTLAWSLHRTAMTEAARAQLKLAAELATAIADRHIDVVFQPVMTLPEGRLVGAEALARWHHPLHGPVPADKFVGLAETHDLICQLGDLVLDQALAGLSTLRARHPDVALRLGVNLSAKQLRGNGIVERTAELLDIHGIPASCLIYELTESVMLEDTDEAIATLQALRSHGVRFAIDDFGTGYSSLANLRQLPFDILKIDRSFVSGMCQSPADHDLVAAITQLGASLHLDVVAEGVELAEQREALDALGCGFVQGHLFSRPRPLDDFGALMSRSGAAMIRRGAAG